MTIDVEDEGRVIRLMQEIGARGPDAPNRERQVELVQQLRASHPSTSPLMDRALLVEVARLRLGLERAGLQQEELRKLLDRLTAPPLHLAVFLGSASAGDRASAGVVGDGGGRRVVNFAEGVDPAKLEVGDEVVLGPERNLIVGRSAFAPSSSGETAVFDRWSGPGRMVVKVRDEELVLTASQRLASDGLLAGDMVRWDRGLWLAFEKVPRSAGSHLFLQTTPAESFDAVGGLATQVAQLQRTIRLHFDHAELVRKYGLQPRSAILLSGPPGTGKTLIARALANWLGSISPARRSHFINVKPGSLHSMWYSQSEANYREAFRVAREAADREPDVPVVMFFDEVDAIGGARGDGSGRVDDRVMTAFLTELNGLESRGKVLVVCATNRRDAMDPALLRSGGRLGDLVLEIPRPNRQAARDILSRHIPVGMPFAEAEGQGERGARDALIDATVTTIFAPNALGELATLTLRDGKRRTVTASDLVSGAALANLARRATEQACLREADGGASGLRLRDLLDAVDAEFVTAAQALTAQNCRRFIETLPQDVDVVKVERPATRVALRPWRYLGAA